MACIEQICIAGFFPFTIPPFGSPLRSYKDFGPQLCDNLAIFPSGASPLPILTVPIRLRAPADEHQTCIPL